MHTEPAHVMWLTRSATDRDGHLQSMALTNHPLPSPMQLTGGGGISHTNNAILAKDSITFDNVTTLTTTRHHRNGKSSIRTKAQVAPVSFTGMFGCAEAYKQCTPSSPANCASESSNCPAGAAPSTLFQGACPGSGSGIEAGWTFNVGGKASAMAVPEQVLNAGLISKKVVSQLMS